MRCINFADPAEKQQHDEMVARVSEMLELQKEYAATAREKFADKMDALKRRIDAVDAAIDAAVYRLYDLSAGEIRVVEGKERIE
jgi:cyclopropane fatty-acyl-phospholipid synthase-like methyltransferase